MSKRWKFGEVYKWTGAQDSGAHIMVITGVPDSLEGRVPAVIIKSTQHIKLGTVRQVTPSSVWWEKVSG